VRKPYLQARGAEWERARIFAMARDNCECQAHKLGLPDIEGCSQEHPENRPRFLQVHHLQERQNGGNHDLDNLITVCRVHHTHIHPHMRFELAASDKVLDAPEYREL